MLAHLTVLLSCQLAGEILVRLFGIPVPGAVLGMMLLFAGLAAKGEVPEGFRRTADGLLRHLSLLFVPAGVGVVAHLTLIADEWVAIGTSLVVSTLLAIVASALVLRWLAPAEAASRKASS